MGFKSFLSAVGHDATAVIRFFGTAQGQRVVQVAEQAAVGVGTAVGGQAVGVGILGIESLFNKGLQDVINMEATSAQLGAQSGTGLQKAAAVSAGLEPLAEKLLKDLGYDNPKAEQVEAIASKVATSFADIVNSIPPPAALASPASGSTTLLGVGQVATTGMTTR